MKTSRLLLLGLSLCFLPAQTALAQPTSPPNADPERVRAIVQAMAVTVVRSGELGGSTPK